MPLYGISGLARTCSIVGHFIKYTYSVDRTSTEIEDIIMYVKSKAFKGTSSNDQKNAQSERNSHSKNQGGKN